MNSMDEASKTRFKMTKKHHRLTLEKADQENKVDTQLRGLCKWIQETENYFTSSGCSGRIALLDIEKENSKLHSFLHRKWHRVIELEEVQQGIETETRGELWFKLDPFILHIGCQSLSHAKALLNLMNKAGIKRGGIFSVKEGRYLVEFIGSHSMSIPVKKEGELLVSPEYIAYVVQRMNEKLTMNYNKLAQLEKIIKEQLTP